MKNNKIFSFVGAGVMLLALAFFGAQSALAADSTIEGNLPNTFSDGVNIYAYNAAQDSACDGIADALEVFYGSKLSATITLDTTYASTDTDYSVTVTEGNISGANLYVYFCDNSNNVIDSYTVADFAASQTRNVSLGKISNGTSSASNDLDNYYIAICTAANGTKYNDVSSQVNAATNQYSQYYAFEQATDGVGDAPPTTITAVFDSTADNCTYVNTTTTKKTGYVIDVTSSSDNYGIVIAFNPDTKVTGDAIAAADLAAAVFTIYNDAGTAETLTDDTSAGMGFEIINGNPDGDAADDDFIIYYDGAKVTNDIHVKIATAANGTTHWLSIDEADFTGAGAYDVLVDLNDSGDGVPTDIDNIQTTCNVSGAGGVDDDAIFKTVALHDTYLYDIYMPACSNSESVLFKTGSTTLVLTVGTVDLTASATVDVGKISGETHAGIQDNVAADNIEIFTGVDCTTEVSSVNVQPTAAAGDDYAVYFQDTDAVVYMKISKDTATYTTCGNSIVAATFDATQVATVDLSIQVTGTVHTDIDRVAVDDDAANSNATDGSTCTAYSNVAAGVYYLYTSTSANLASEVDAASNVFFVVAASPATELLETTKDLTSSQTVGVGRITGATANVHADLTDAAGDPHNLVAYDAADGTTAVSSETVNMEAATYKQYFEVPTGLAINIEVQLAADNSKKFYVYNKTVAAGTSYTFEPSSKITATFPATVLGFEVAQDDGGGYVMRDKTSTFIIYVDKTEEAADTDYDYRAYTEAAFTNVVLDRSGKDVSGAATWGVNTVTNTAIHADVTGDTDPVDVYTSAAGTTADCTTTLRSSDTTQVWANGSLKYYETNAGTNINLKITDGSYVSCVNTLIAAAAAGGDDAYSIDIKTSGNVNPDIITVYIDSDEAGGDDISQATVAGTPSTYAILWAGDADSDIAFYDVTPTLRLDIDSRDLSATATVNVAKVSGAAQEALATIVVYSDAACSSAVSTEVVDPTLLGGYTQYFEGVDATTYRIAVTDATPHTSCFTSGFTPSTQAATVNFDRKISGSVPDVSDTTLDVLSVTADTGDDTYWVNTVDPGAAPNTYAIYVDDADSAIATSGLSFQSAVTGGGTALLTVVKDASAGDATANASAAYGASHASVDHANAVCSDHAASNVTCTTKYSTLAANGAGATYEIFFEQQGGTAYFLEVLDHDTQDYYSWNAFTSAAAGAYTNVELDGKLDGYVAEAFDSPTTRVPEVTIKMYTDAGDPETNQISLTYSYTGTADPGGTYRMYGNLTDTNDAQYAKAGYITQSAVAVPSLPDTVNVDLVSGLKVTVAYEGGQKVTDATVSLYVCSSTAVADCTTTLDTCTNPSGNCTITGDNTAGTGSSGEYYFGGMTVGTYVQVKVVRSGFDTVYDPDPASLATAYTISSSAAITPSFVVRNSVASSPTLVTPADKLVTTDTTPDFVWADLGGDETDYEVQIDDDPAFASVHAGGGTTGSGSTVTFTADSALTDDTLYYWRVRGIDGNGNGAWGVTRSFYVNAGWNTMAAPTLANTATTSPVTVSWTAETGATSYKIYRKSSSPVAITDTYVGTSATNSFIDPNPADGSWYYGVVPVDGSNASGTISTTSAAVTVDTAAPTSLSLVAENGADYTSDKDALTVAYVGQGVTTYALSCDGATYVALDGTSPDDIDLSAFGAGCTDTQGTKTLWLRGADASNNYEYTTDEIYLDYTVPTIGVLTATNTAGQRTVTLTWTAATDANSGVDHYDVYRDPATGVNKTDTLVASGLTTLGYLDYPEDGTWYYTVYATDKAGNESVLFVEKTVTVDTTPVGIVTTPPAATYTAATLAAAGGVSITPDTAGTCKWDTIDAPYASMGLTEDREFVVLAATAYDLTALADANDYTLQNGTNGLYVRCKDANNNYNLNSTFIMFTYDSVAPSYQLVSVTSNGNGRTVNGVLYANLGDIITVRFQASESLAGDPTVTIGGQAMAKASELGGLYTYTRTLTNAETTTAAIAISGTTDVAGNGDTDFSDAGVAEFDFTDPTVVVTAPGTQNSKSFLINATAETLSDCRMDETNVVFDSMDRFALAETAVAGTFQGTYLVATDNAYTIYVRCRDYAGNEGTSNSGAFTVNTTQPSVLTITPTLASGWQTAANASFTLTTDVNATCKYDANESASYALMDATFTGGGGTSHTADIANADGINSYYVLCQNTYGVTMSNAITISWKGDVNNPSVPVRVLPTSGAGYVTGSVLLWSASTDGAGSGINNYHLDIDNSNAFGSPEISTDVSGTAYALTAGNITSLNAGTNYWRVQAVDTATNASGFQGTDHTFTLDKTAPTVEEMSPADGNTSASISVTPLLIFDEEILISTLTNTNIKLYKYSDDSEITLDATGGILATNRVSEDGTYKTYVYIVPAADLSYGTQYYITISASVVDVSGNAITAWTALNKSSHEFTTAAQATGSLAVTGVSQTRFYGTNDATYANGWAWTISATIPTDELSVSLKFADWTGPGTATLPVASNMRYYCAESAAHTTEGTAITLTAANSYADGPMTIVAGSDLDTSTTGIQVQIIVQTKIPLLQTAGSYSTSYGIQSQ